MKPVIRTARHQLARMLPGYSGRFFFNRLIVLVTLSALLVLALGVFASRSLATLNAGTEWSMQAQHVRLQLSHVLQLLLDMGGGVRRYEMTHDERSFQDAEAAAAALPHEMGELHALLAEEPGLQAHEVELIAAAKQRVEQTRATIGMARAGDVDGIRAMIERGDNLAILDRCRAVIGMMQDEENRNFDRHRRISATARDSVQFAIAATTTLAVALLILVAYFSLRHSVRLQRAQNALHDADRRKDIFLATLSHELRNPLAPIRTAAKLLESDSLSTEQFHRSRRIISRQVGHMASLLDDLLDVSRITRGMLALRKETVSLRSLFEASVETARPAIDAKHHVLAVEWPASDLRVEVDPLRVTQIVTNLLTNAAKYTEPGGHIFLQAQRSSSDVVISVRDTGIGIASTLLVTIFEMFSQVAPGKSQDGGLGIGLALVKGLVELHGGTVEARSAGLGLGSEFVISLPGAIVDPAPALLTASVQR